MQVLDRGVLPPSICFSFTPSDLMQHLYFYMSWCGHYYCNSNYSIRRKHFPYLLLAYVCKGKFHIEYEEHVLDAHAGDVVFIDCSRPHFYSAKCGLEFLYVNFAGTNSADIFQHLYAEYGPLIKKKSNRMIGENINSIVATYQNGEIEDPAKSSLRLYQLCAQLLARDENEEMKPINKTIRYIKANVGNPINLNMLAGIAHMSPYYYAHAFKEQTGFSPIEYVINSRIERAKVLLLTTTDTVEQIAYQVGYSASSSFITIFLKRTGSTPTDYRYGR